MRSLAALVVLVTLCSITGSVFACGAQPDPYVTIESIVIGSDAEAFPRNAAILIRLKLWEGPNEANQFEPSVRVVRIDNGETAAGTIESAAQQDTMLWIPKQPLAAVTQYRIEVSTTTQIRADIAAPTSASAVFSTAVGLADSALELANGLVVTWRVGKADINDCLCASCTKTGERSARYADITLPSVTGGFDAYGYTAWLTLTNDTAPTFNGPGEGKNAGPVMVNLATYLKPKPGERTNASVEIPEETSAYNPCFGFNVWDAVGQWQSAEPTCIAAADIEAAFAKLDKPGAAAAADTAAAGSGSRAPVDSNAESSGCSAAVGGRASQPTAALWVVAALGWLRVRRRRHG